MFNKILNKYMPKMVCLAFIFFGHVFDVLAEKKKNLKIEIVIIL